MILKKSCLSLFLILSQLAVAQPEPVMTPTPVMKYPRLDFVRSGQAKKGAPKALAQNYKKSGTVVDLKKNDLLTESAKIVTSADAEVKISLDPYTHVIVFENSILELPVITWGEGEVPDLILEKGRIQVSCEKDCSRQFITPLSKNMFTNGVFILEYRPENSFVELTALHGEQEFRGLENEAFVKIQSGQKVVFQGLKENDEIAYDILLKGRKVARGKLQPVITMKAEEVEALEVKSQKLKPIIVVKPKAPPRLASQICDAPYGELNQCSWTCEGLSKKKTAKSCDLTKAGVHCVRRRCNANGLWEDATIMTQQNQRCEVKPLVAACDY